MAETGNRSAAADAAGISLTTLNRYAANDPEFREKLDDAKARYIRVLEAEAHRRAVEGWDEDRMGSGGSLYSVRKYDSALLLHLLKKKAPEEHGDRVTVDQTTTVKGDIGLKNLAPESRELLRQILEREADGQEAEGEDE